MFCVVSGTAMAANDGNGLCDLIVRMQDIFKILRTLAFVGAGFMLAKYAWEAISSGKINGKDKLVEGAQSIGIPMLVGLILLFGIGTFLQVLSSASGAKLLGCTDAIFQGW